MKADKQPFLFSLKPCYADLVFQGLKEAELRRRISPYMENSDVFIYVSSPVRQLRGGFRIGRVWSGTLDQVWEQVSGFAGIDKQDFYAYYAGCSIAYALKITNVWEYQNPVGLNEIRSQFPSFVVPQSWRYFKPEEHQSFRPLVNAFENCEI